MTLPEPHDEQPTTNQPTNDTPTEQSPPPAQPNPTLPDPDETPPLGTFREDGKGKEDAEEVKEIEKETADPVEIVSLDELGNTNSAPSLVNRADTAEPLLPNPDPEAAVTAEATTNSDGLTDEENRAMLEMFLALPPLNGEEETTSSDTSDTSDTIEERVLAAIDMDGLLETLDQWVSIRSLDGTPAENLAQEKVADTMRQIGLDVEMWEFTYADVQDHPSFCVEVERPRSIGVVGKFGAGHETGRSLILNGHTDVVPAGDLSQWTVPPWEVTVRPEENRVYGRGALDMKGNLACGLYAIKAIKDAGIALDGQVLLQSVVGEEDGGVGTLAAVVRGYTADAAIVLEPTELMIAPAQAGALNFRVTIPGYPAHGAMRSEGVDPLEKFILIYQAILTFEKVRNAQADHPLFDAYEMPYPICCGTIQGGNWASTVAESLTFEGRLGVAVDEEPAAARRAFEELIGKTAMADRWLRKHPPTVEWWGGQFAPAAIRQNHPIVKTVEEALQTITGRTPTIQGMTYGADMRLLVNDGRIPTILFGAGDVRKAHQFDEYVPLDELETVVKTVALTILEFCGITQSKP